MKKSRNNTSKERTRQKINDALSELLQKKHLDDITTTELVATAGISRSSFYTHYSDRYDMLEKVMKQLIAEFKSYQQKNIAEIFHAEITYIQENKIYASLLSYNSSHEITSYLQQLIKTELQEDILSRWKDYQELPEKQQDYLATYTATGFTAVLQQWVNSGLKESPDAIVSLLLIAMPWIKDAAAKR